MVGWPSKCPLIYVGKLTVSTQLIKKKLIVFHSPYFEMVPLFAQWLSLSLRDHFDFCWDHFDYIKPKKVQKYSEDTSSCF